MTSLQAFSLLLHDSCYINLHFDTQCIASFSLSRQQCSCVIAPVSVDKVFASSITKLTARFVPVIFPVGNRTPYRAACNALAVSKLPNLRYHPDICQQGRRRNVAHLSQSSSVAHLSQSSSVAHLSQSSSVAHLSSLLTLISTGDLHSMKACFCPYRSTLVSNRVRFIDVTDAARVFSLTHQWRRFWALQAQW